MRCIATDASFPFVLCHSLPLLPCSYSLVNTRFNATNTTINRFKVAQLATMLQEYIPVLKHDNSEAAAAILERIEELCRDFVMVSFFFLLPFFILFLKKTLNLEDIAVAGSI